MIHFLVRWGITAVAVMVAVQVVPGLECPTWEGLLVAALVLGLLNAFVRPLLTLVSLPLILVTFGLFLWIINAALLSLVGWLVKPFVVDSFWSALGGAAVISLVSGLAGSLLGVDRRPPGKPGTRPPSRPSGPDGPVIDV